MENIYLNNSELLSKLSDVIRVIDPLQKRVFEYTNKDIRIREFHCFDFWDKHKACENCISMRAYINDKTYVKIDYNKENAYLVTAIPHKINDTKVAIEIIKDVTDSLRFNSFEVTDIELIKIHEHIDNLNKLAFIDPLTNLYNRRYINEKIPVDLLNGSLLSKGISIIMADIDYFKTVNDKYGHFVGDLTLKKVAEKLTSCIKRESDWVARYGGEEFLICMPGANIEAAKTMAETMRKSIEDSVIQYEDVFLKVTVSFGIYNLKPSGSEGIDDLLRRADEKLFMAKRNGRNRIEF